MRRRILTAVVACFVSGALPAVAQVKQTKEQMMFYTTDWKGERFPDGRPKVADSLLKRALDLSIEDVWDYLREQGYRNQFESGWQALHIDKPFAGRALTAQYMPIQPTWPKPSPPRASRRGVSAGIKTAGPLTNCRSEMFMWPTASGRSLKVL